MVFLQEKKVWLDKMRRNRKKKKISKYPVRCIVLLSVEPQEGIDYVEKKQVKKPAGGKPGFVVYYTNYSMMIDSDIRGIKEG